MGGYSVQSYITKKNVMLVLIGIVGLIFIFVVYDNLHFRLRSTSPSLNNVATSSVEIIYNFSQPIESIQSVTFNGKDVTNDISINNKSVSIPLDTSLSDESTYEIVLHSVISQWFNNKINSIEREFTPKYIDFNKLSEEQQKAQINASNSGQVNDRFIDDNTFPILTKEWQIEATVVQSDRVAILTVKFLDEIPDYDNGGATVQLPNDVAEKYRQEVIDEIKDRGGNPEDYTIVYETNKYLNEKYNLSEQTHEH